LFAHEFVFLGQPAVVALTPRCALVRVSLNIGANCSVIGRQTYLAPIATSCLPHVKFAPFMRFTLHGLGYPALMQLLLAIAPGLGRNSPLCHSVPAPGLTAPDATLGLISKSSTLPWFNPRLFLIHFHTCFPV
jgi:hypothetical protein